MQKSSIRTGAAVVLGLLALTLAVYAVLFLSALSIFSARPADLSRLSAPGPGKAQLALPPSRPLSTSTQTRAVSYTATAAAHAAASLTPTNTATLTGTSSPLPVSEPASPSATDSTEPPELAGRQGQSCPLCEVEHVVLISIDGLRPDAWEQADTPVLDGLRTRGAFSPRAQAVLPSVTLVNHASMLSGMGPEKHGITWNDKIPELGKVNGPTVFSLAHEAGLSTAMVVGKPKLEHLVLPGSVDTYDYAGFTDGQVVRQALALVRTGLPDLLFIHLPDVDSAGHAAGWMSMGQLVAVAHTDNLIGEIVAALEAGGYQDRTLLIITADHGGSGRRHGSNAPEDTTVPWLAVGPGTPAGLVLEDGIVAYDTAATILQAFGLPIPKTWDGRPVLGIFEAAF